MDNLKTDNLKTDNRRTHVRMPYGAWLENETSGGLHFYLAENLSLGGILLKTEGMPPPIGHRVRLRLVIENESRVMSVHGEVIRHSAEVSGGFAVQFTHLDSPRILFLRELVAEQGTESL